MRDDWLDQATRAARDVEAASTLEAARTRRRLLLSAAEQARPRRVARGPWFGLAVAALFVGGVCAAASSYTRLAARVGRARAPADVAIATERPEAAGGSGGADRSPLAASGAEVVVPSSSHVASAVAPSASSGLAAPRAGTLSTTTRAASASDAPERGDLDALYAQAHALHFRAHDPARALAAWDRYLAAAPADVRAGFVLEARYNRAICLLRLGRRSEAREALRPFASGAWGQYRRDEARALLGSAALRGEEEFDGTMAP
jgi:hypothetical protein